MSPPRRSTGATCWGHPRRCPLQALKCHRRRRPQVAGRDKTVGLSSRQVAPLARVDQQSARSRAAPSGTGVSKSQGPAPRQADPSRRSEERPASARQLYDGSDRPDSDSLQRRWSSGRSSDSASTSSAPPVVEPSAAPRRLQSLLIRGGRAPDVHEGPIRRPERGGGVNGSR
jgi:hypothetical protein